MVALDIETVPDETREDYIALKKSTLKAPSTWKDPVKIKANIDEKFAKLTDKAALDPRTGRIMMIGLLSDKQTNENFKPVNGNLFTVQLTALAPELEPVIISEALRILSKCFDESTEMLATYNGKDFDIPFIAMRSLLLGVPRPAFFPSYSSLTSPYDTRTHLDVFKFLGDVSEESPLSRKGTLSEWSYLFNDSNTFASDGGRILENFKAGNMEWILQKNLDDLYKTYYLAQRIKSWLN